jgi:hypothetical protein
MTQTFIPEGSYIRNPAGFGCFNHPLTLNTVHGHNKRYPKGSLLFQTYSSWPSLKSSSSIYPIKSGPITSANTVTPFLGSRLRVWGPWSGYMTILTSSSWSLWNQVLQAIRAWSCGTGSKNFGSGSLGVLGNSPMPIFTLPWALFHSFG